jgi:hypothetical protein
MGNAEVTKSQNRLLWLISNSSRLSLVAVFLGGYLLAGILFGLIYWVGDMTSAGDILGNVYFSLLVQMSLGGQQSLRTTELGKLLTVIQFLFGTLWLVFLPSVIIVRLTTPAKRVFQFDQYMIFYPKLRSFRVRYVNFSRLDAVSLDFDLRARLVVDDADYNVRSLAVELNNPSHPDARSMVPFVMRTRVVEPSQFKIPDGRTDYSIVLHPGHLRGDLDLSLRLSCLYSTGSFNKTVTFSYQQVICGRFVPIQPGRDVPPDWDNLNRHLPIEDTDEGQEYCRDQCPFRERCRIGNKVM